MLLNIYELAVALDEIYKEENLTVSMYELGLSINDVGVMEIKDENNYPVNFKLDPTVHPDYKGMAIVNYPRAIANAIASFKDKYFVIAQKELALQNISANIEKMSDSNIEILNLAFESARNAYKLRQDLELSVLNSRLKLLEIDIMKIKTMTASEFEAKYGAV